MAGDLPDYTKYVTPQPKQPITITGFGTKAETVAKKSAKASGTTSCTVDLDVPPAGKKTGLILVLASSNVGDGYVSISTRQSGLWVSVLTYARILANDTNKLVFPCWIPTQDVSDGVHSNVRVVVNSASCPPNVAVNVIYFEE